MRRKGKLGSRFFLSAPLFTSRATVRLEVSFARPLSCTFFSPHRSGAALFSRRSTAQRLPLRFLFFFRWTPPSRPTSARMSRLVRSRVPPLRCQGILSRLRKKGPKESPWERNGHCECGACGMKVEWTLRGGLSAGF